MSGPVARSHREIDRRRRGHTLHRLTIEELKRRAPRLMPSHDLVEGPHERLVDEGSILPDADGLVVDRVPRGQTAEEPQLLLRGRETGGTLPTAPFDSREL